MSTQDTTDNAGETPDIWTTAEMIERTAMPRCGAAHADPESTTAESKLLPEDLGDDEDKSPAEWAYARLILYIQSFEEDLDEEHEVAMGYAGSAAGLLRIEGIGFFAPDLVTFYGKDDGGLKTQLIQHVTQLNVTLSALPKQVEAEPARRIGFRLAASLKEGQAAP